MKAHGIYLTQSFFPNSNGGTLHNCGLIRYLQNYLSIDVYSYLGDKYNIEEAYKSYHNEPFNVHFCSARGKIRRFNAKMALIEPVNAEMLNDILKCIRENDVKFIFYVIRMYEFVAILKKEFPNINYIYISHNCEYMNILSDLRHYDKAHNVTKIMHVFKIIRSKAFVQIEGKCLRNANAIFSITQYDSERLSNRFGIPISKFITSKPMIRYTSMRENDAWSNNNFTHSIIIVGNMNWYPTEEGVVWFVNMVFPTLQARDHQCKLYIVGANPSAEVRNLSNLNCGITVTGYVDSIEEYYRKCDIAVIPVFSGTGAKIKALEAIGMHIPTVMSNYAAKDYDGMSESVLVAKDYDANDFINKIEKLLKYDTFRKEASEKEEKYYSNYMTDSKPVREYMESTINELETTSHSYQRQKGSIQTS